MFEEGRGVPRDSKKAAKWFRKAAKNGFAGAKASLDDLEYREFARSTEEWSENVQGEAEPNTQAAEPDTQEEPVPSGIAVVATAAAGVSASSGSTPSGTATAVTAEPADESAAAEPGSPADLRLRAEGGDADAQFEMGRLYSAGRDVKVDMETALRWYLAAAEQGHAMAAYTVGFAYYRSRGVDNDLVQAYRWFSEAADLGVGDASEWVRKIEAKLNGRQREEAERILAESR